MATEQVDLSRSRASPTVGSHSVIELFLASVGFMPAGPRLSATGVLSIQITRSEVITTPYKKSQGVLDCIKDIFCSQSHPIVKATLPVDHPVYRTSFYCTIQCAKNESLLK
jgi:hypothetical protein